MQLHAIPCSEWTYEMKLFAENYLDISIKPPKDVMYYLQYDPEWSDYDVIYFKGED